MDPWFKIVEQRKDLPAGRSFNPDELSIRLEQVVVNLHASDRSKEEKYWHSPSGFLTIRPDHGPESP